MNIQTFDDFCQILFEDIEKRLKSIQNTSFWSTGNSSILKNLVIKESNANTGSWYAESSLPEVGNDEYGGISVSVTPGEVRVGLILPCSYVTPDFRATGNGREEIMAKTFSGQRCNKSLRLSDTHWLFDHFFSTDPFSAQWMFEAHTDYRKFQATSVRLSYIILTCWKSALQTIVDSVINGHHHDSEFIVLSKRMLSNYDLNSRAENGHYYRIKKTVIDRESCAVLNIHQYRISGSGHIEDLKKIVEQLDQDAVVSISEETDFLY